MPGLILQGQSIRARHPSMAMQDGLIGMDGQGRVDHPGMGQGQIHSRLQMGQLATHVDGPYHAHGPGPFQLLVDRADGDRILSALPGLPVHLLGEGDHRDHVGVIVDDSNAFGQRLGVGSPAAVAMMPAHGPQSRVPYGPTCDPLGRTAPTKGTPAARIAHDGPGTA